MIHLWPDNWRSPPFDTSFAQVGRRPAARRPQRRGRSCVHALTALPALPAIPAICSAGSTPTLPWPPSWASPWCWKSLVRPLSRCSALLRFLGRSHPKPCSHAGPGWLPASRSASHLSYASPPLPGPAGKNAAENEIASIRDPWFSLTNGAVEASLGSGGALRGALFWQWDGESGPRPDNGSNIRQVRCWLFVAGGPCFRRVNALQGGPPSKAGAAQRMLHAQHGLTRPSRVEMVSSGTLSSV